jgi:hypothetical protein
VAAVIELIEQERPRHAIQTIQLVARSFSWTRFKIELAELLHAVMSAHIYQHLAVMHLQTDMLVIWFFVPQKTNSPACPWKPVEQNDICLYASEF